MQNPPVELKPTQKEFLNAFFSQKYKFLLYGGRVNTGKTYTCAILLVGLANDFPKSRFAVIRKNLTTARRTTWHTFMKVLETFQIPYTANKVDWIIKFANGSTIEFVEADQSKDPDFNKLKGLEVSGCLLEEANELLEEVFSMMMTRIGRWNVNGVPSFILLTCNPNNTWVKTKFYEPATQRMLKKPFFFLEPTFEEIPKDFRDTLKYLPDLEYQRFAEGDWNYSDDPAQLISYEWIKANACDPDTDHADRLSVDVARYGDDRTILGYGLGNSFVHYEAFTKQDTHVTAEIAEQRMAEKRIGTDKVIVDVVGLGAGVVDTMRAHNLAIREFNGAETSEYWFGSFAFTNNRAESYWKLREGLKNNEIKIINNPDVIKELTNVRYMIKNKVIYIESKDEIKKRLAFSPDIADTIAMMFSFDTKNNQVSTGKSIFTQVDLTLPVHGKPRKPTRYIHRYGRY